MSSEGAALFEVPSSVWESCPLRQASQPWCSWAQTNTALEHVKFVVCTCIWLGDMWKNLRLYIFIPGSSSVQVLATGFLGRTLMCTSLSIMPKLPKGWKHVFNNKTWPSEKTCKSKWRTMYMFKDRVMF